MILLDLVDQLLHLTSIKQRASDPRVLEFPGMHTLKSVSQCDNVFVEQVLLIIEGAHDTSPEPQRFISPGIACRSS